MIAVLAGRAGLALVYAQSNDEIPLWFKQSTGAWTEGFISDAQFIERIETLIASGVVDVAVDESNNDVSCGELMDDIHALILAYGGTKYLASQFDPDGESYKLLTKHRVGFFDEYMSAADDFNSRDCDPNDNNDQRKWDVISYVADNLDMFEVRHDTSSVTGSNGGSVGDSRNQDSCVLFCDYTGYEPAWAKSMGPWQASSYCDNIAIDDSNAYLERMMDQLNDWDVYDDDYSLDLGDMYSKDGRWCNEYYGYLLDSMYQ